MKQNNPSHVTHRRNARSRVPSLRARSLFVCCLSLALAGLVQAQPLALEAALVSSGAGAVEEGTLRVDVAVGQPAVGRTSGGTLEVELGFLTIGAMAGVGAEEGGEPATFALDANYPNPFALSTSISYTLPEAVEVRLEVFDVLGRRVRTLLDAEQGAGRHTVSVTAESLASGVYLYRLTAGTHTATRQMQLIR